MKPGDSVKAEDSLVTLESDKATMDVPSPSAGVVKEVKVKVGDKVSEGALILTLEAAAADAAATPASAPAAAAAPAAPAAAPSRPTLSRERRQRSGRPLAHASRRDAARLASPACGRGVGREGRAGRSGRLHRRARVAVGARVRARAGRRSRARRRDRPEGSHPAGRRAEVREAGDVRRGGRRAARAASAAAARSISCRGPESTSRSSGRSRRSRCRESRRSPAPISHRNWVMIPHVTQYDEADITELEAFRVRLNKENEKSRHQGDDARVPDQGERVRAEEVSGRSTHRWTATASSTSSTSTSASPPTRRTASSSR